MVSEAFVYSTLSRAPDTPVRVRDFVDTGSRMRCLRLT